MARWRHRTRPDSTKVVLAPVDTVVVPRQRGAPTSLDLALRRAHDSGTVADPVSLWHLLREEHPDATADQELVAAVAATHLGLTSSPRTVLFATSSHLHAADELHRLVSWDYSVLQSVGRLSGGFPRLQVIVAREGEGNHLVIGTYELAPNHETGVFWHELCDAVVASRPDLGAHAAGTYGGLGVPPATVHT